MKKRNQKIVRRTFTNSNLSKFNVLLLMVFLFSYHLGLSRNKITKIPKLQQEDVEVIKEAFNLWKTKGEEVWKGWTKIHMPFIYRKKNFEYRINFPSSIKEKGQFVERIENMDVYGKNIQKKNVVAASKDINNISAVVLSSPSILEMTKTEWIITAMHEMFHVFQSSSKIYQNKIKNLNIAYGNDASWMLNYPFPYKDTSLNTMSHMQGYLLYKIYQSADFKENMYDCFLLKDILTLYKNEILRKYGNEKNYKYSNFQQSIEGVAKYTEIKMAEIAATDYVPLSPKIHFTDIYTNQINVIRHCGKGTGGRLTFYYLGLGKCLVLDKINHEWKNSYFTTAWLDEIFNNSLQQIVEKQLKNKKY